MYINPKRDKTYLRQLISHMSSEYHLPFQTITPAKRGYYGETWKLETKNQTYFLKLDYLSRHQKNFQNSLAVIDDLQKKGIDYIGQVIPTKNNQLYTTFNGAIVGLFNYVEGYNLETDGTKASEYFLLSQIYQLSKPDFCIPTLQFNDEAAERFYAKWNQFKERTLNDGQIKSLDILEKHHTYLDHVAQRLKEISQICAKDTTNFYITHGDAGGNYVVGKDKNYILDWDEVMYAPLERDAWVMCCKDFARDLFNETMRLNNIPYSLNQTRLAFFCYHMFFHYLNEFLDDLNDFDMSQRIKDYFEDCWITERIKYADTIKTREE